MKKFLFLPALLLILVLALPSCRVLNPSIMLQTRKDYKFDTLKMDSMVYKTQEYHISPNDIIEFRLFTNDGFTIINLTSQGNTNAAALNRLNFQYQLNGEGVVKLPVIGFISLKGLSVHEAEDTLQKAYSKYYVDPFAMIEVISKRVIIFPGNDGLARVVGLTNSNTTLLEAIAQAGGVPESGKSYYIKLIRSNGNPGHPSVYKIDLSHIEGMAQANLIVQANDVIYVEPRRYFARETLREVTPILTLLTSTLALYALFTR